MDLFREASEMTHSNLTVIFNLARALQESGEDCEAADWYWQVIDFGAGLNHQEDSEVSRLELARRAWAAMGDLKCDRDSVAKVQ